MIALLFAFLAQTSPEPAPTLVIRGGRIFDVEKGGTRELGQLWIAGERIVGEKPATAAIPKDVATIDASGATLLPGLFDLHAHLMVSGGSMTGGLVLDGAENLATHAAFGVTHVVDLHGDPATTFALRERSTKEPGLARLLGAGAAFTAPGGHGTQFNIEANVVTTPAEVEQRFTRLLTWKPDVVKAIVEHGGWGSVPRMPALDEKLLAELARRTHAAKLPLFVHVWTLDEAKSAVRAGADVLAHGVFSGDVDDELVKLMKEHATAYVPTLAVVVGGMRVAKGASPYTKERVDSLLHPDLAAQLVDSTSASWAASWTDASEPRFFANLKRIFDAGIRVGTGTDCGNPVTPHGPALLFECQLFVEAGLTPVQALRCATLESARIVHLDRDFGSLAAGKVADVVVVRGDPTKDVKALWNVEKVVESGRLVDRDALARRNAERAKTASSPVTLLKVGESVPATLDDFDDGDLECAWGGTWTVTSDALAPSGKSKVTAEIVESEESGHLLVKGTVAEGFQFGPFAGVSVQWSPDAKRLVDLSGAKDVVLRIRGTPRDATLALDRAAVKDFDVFSATLHVEDAWQELRVPLASFKQIGFGKAVPAAWLDVKGLTLTARAAPGSTKGIGDFELEVDWIRVE
jgi:imidazolonepropionase-like amidohydrolase